MQQQNQESQAAPLANSIIDTCRRLGVGRTTVYELIQARELRAFKVGNRTLIAETELTRFVQKRAGVTA